MIVSRLGVGVTLGATSGLALTVTAGDPWSGGGEGGAVGVD